MLDGRLAGRGTVSMEWAASRMPVLSGIIDEMSARRPLEGARIASCLQITKETAVLLHGAMKLGAEVCACAGNPLTTQDEAAAALESLGADVYGWSGQNRKQFEWCLGRAARSNPTVVADDGAQLMQLVGPGPAGGVEETRTGAVRARAAQKAGRLPYPVVVVDEARTKHLFDSKLGTGQSSIDGLMRAGGLSMSGGAAVAGYGAVGRGVASRCRAMGARVTVTETNARAALEAAMDGFDVAPMARAARKAKTIVTCTGMKGVVSARHLARAPGAMLANAGHFDVEIDAAYLMRRARKAREHVHECRTGAGSAYLVSEGRVANLAAAEGHPPEVMDFSFSGQLLSMIHVHENGGKLSHGVAPMPAFLDEQVARRALVALGGAGAGLSRPPRGRRR